MTICCSKKGVGSKIRNTYFALFQVLFKCIAFERHIVFEHVTFVA